MQEIFYLTFQVDEVITGIYKNAQKIGAPNAWLEAQEALSSIVQMLYGLSTSKGSEFPDFVNPLRQITDTIEGQQGSLIQNNVPIQTQEVSEEVVRTSALPSNINQNTGLTRIDEALLSRTKKKQCV